jgi:hypothetical protein
MPSSCSKRSERPVASQKGSLKIPKRKARPVTVSKPQKRHSKPKSGIPLDELLAAHAAGRCWQRCKTARIGGELRLCGSIGPAWIPFEAQICEDVVVHDESTDRTNGDRNDSSPGGNALFRRCSIRSQASLPFPPPMMASTPRSSRSCYVRPVRGSQRHYAQSRSCIADDTDALVRRVSGAHAHCFGNADQTRAAIDAAPRAHPSEQ